MKQEGNLVYERKPRYWQETNDLKKIDNLIASYLLRENPIIKLRPDPNLPPPPKTKVKFTNKKPDSTYVIKMERDIPVPGNEASLYLIAAKPIELEFKVLQKKQEYLLIQPTKFRIAEIARRFERIDSDDNKVYATNFLIAKETLEESSLYGISSQILLEGICKNSLPQGIRYFILYEEDKEFQEEREICFQSGKSIFILDTNNFKSFESEVVLDAKKVFEEELILEEKKLEYKQKKIHSILFYPITIPFGERKKFATLVAIQETGSLPNELLETFQLVQNIFLDRILASNTYTLDVHQKVINLSRHGIGLEISNDKIRKSLRVRPSLTIDLNFKMQQPLRVALDVVYIWDYGAYDIVGTEIIGFSGDKEGPRKYELYLDYVKKI